MKYSKIWLLGIGIGMGVFGFGAGKIDLQPDKELQVSEDINLISQEISLIQMNEIQGDALQVNISGPVRILWGKNNFIEGDGQYEIPIPQIPDENDRALETFAFTGNTNTMKFYPSDSHFARCVKVSDRRLFETKELAINAGFAPSKSVK